MRRRVLERLRSAIFCLLTLLIVECRDRTLQQKATARSWPPRPLQIVKPLQPSKSNFDQNPPPRGHSPKGPATYVAVCSGATRECLFMPAYPSDFGVQKSDSAADSHSTNLAASTATNTGTASTVKIEPRPKYPPRGHSPKDPATYVAACSGATQECHFLPAYFVDFGMQRSDSAGDSHSMSLATPTATNTGTASTIKIEPRPKSPATGTLPDWSCKLCGGVLWSDSGLPFSARLTC